LENKLNQSSIPGVAVPKGCTVEGADIEASVEAMIRGWKEPGFGFCRTEPKESILII
jgi:hypothetical protein